MDDKQQHRQKVPGRNVFVCSPDDDAQKVHLQSVVKDALFLRYFTESHHWLAAVAAYQRVPTAKALHRYANNQVFFNCRFSAQFVLRVSGLIVYH